MDTAIYLPWTLDSDKKTMCFVYWRYMVSALHIYSYFWSFNPSCRLLDEDIEPDLWHSRWNQVMHGVTRANSGNPQCFLYSLDNWTQEPAVRPDNWIWLMQLSPGNAYTFLVFMSREVVCYRNWLNRYLFPLLSLLFILFANLLDIFRACREVSGSCCFTLFYLILWGA
jgi:hypothetical protein